MSDSNADARNNLLGRCVLFFSAILSIVVIPLGGLWLSHSTHYNFVEAANHNKRDRISSRLVIRVENVIVSLQKMHGQHKDLVEQFSTTISARGEIDLRNSYDKLSAEFGTISNLMEQLSSDIDSIEQVAWDLFDDENQYIEIDQLQKSWVKYRGTLEAMHQATEMSDGLQVYRDSILYLKHNLNSEAAEALKSELATLREDVDELLAQINYFIVESDEFVASLNSL